MRLLSRFGVYGDFWTRFLDWGAQQCPFFLEPVFIAGYTLLFFLVAGRQRRAVMANLAVVLPGTTAAGNFFRAFLVFRNFAWSLADAARTRGGQEVISWEIEGVEHFEALRDGESGVLIVTAHMGNYDVAAPFFAGRFRRKFHSVRAPERQAELQEYMEKHRAVQNSDSFQVRYNAPGEFLGVELARALAAGEVVALQGDRVLPHVSAVKVPWHGKLWPLPRGPFMLSLASGAPLVPFFVVRSGWRRYRVMVLAPGRPEMERARRATANDVLVAWWLEQIGPMVERHWDQWLVFEPLFEEPEQPRAA